MKAAQASESFRAQMPEERLGLLSFRYIEDRRTWEMPQSIGDSGLAICDIPKQSAEIANLRAKTLTHKLFRNLFLGEHLPEQPSTLGGHRCGEQECPQASARRP